MTEVQNANNRFNTLWEEVGAKKITIGDEDKGVEIVIDADLSIFNILDKLKKESEASHQKGGLSNKDVKAINKAADAIKEVMEGGRGTHKRWDDHFKKFFRKK